MLDRPIDDLVQNYYGSLCTEMYELLHPEAPEDELAFYLSYAERGRKILEPLCGSGRFLVPFLERGYDITGMDLSGEMLERLRRKAPEARAVQADITAYDPGETFDYIFISSGSVSLFTDIALCKAVLRRMGELLSPGGTFVFAVDTVAARCPDDREEKVAVSVKTPEGLDLILKSRDRYDEATGTQFSPSVYELWRDGTLLRREPMDFQTHLYRFGEMEAYLREAGFSRVAVYSAFDKTPAVDDRSGMLLFECGKG